MKWKLPLTVAFSLAAVQPNTASASTLILDTGTPQGTMYPVLEPGTGFAAEFGHRGSDDHPAIDHLQAGTGGQGTAFTFAIYSDTGFIGSRNLAAQFQYSIGATFESNGWNGAAANWTVPTSGNYWVAVEMGSCSRNCPQLDWSPKLGYHRQRAGAWLCVCRHHPPVPTGAHGSIWDSCHRCSRAVDLGHDDGGLPRTGTARLSTQGQGSAQRHLI